MPDREKVIKGLECCTQEMDCPKCPYCNDDYSSVALCNFTVMEDALALLREQDPVTIMKHKPLQISSGLTYCGVCRRYLPRPSTAYPGSWNFCAWCGSEIDWSNVVPEDRGPWLYREGTEAKDDALD